MEQGNKLFRGTQIQQAEAQQQSAFRKHWKKSWRWNEKLGTWLEKLLPVSSRAHTNPQPAQEMSKGPIDQSKKPAAVMVKERQDKIQKERRKWRDCKTRFVTLFLATGGGGLWPEVGSKTPF